MRTEIWDAYDKHGNKLGFDLYRDHPIPNGVYHFVVEIYAVTEQKEILITQRHPDKSWGLKWEITGGSIVKGETPEQGAVRELEEETGIVVNASELHPVYTMIRDDAPSIYRGFVVFIMKNETTIRLQDGETIDYRYVPYPEFKQFIKSDEYVPTVRERFQQFESSFDEIIL